MDCHVNRPQMVFILSKQAYAYRYTANHEVGLCGTQCDVSSSTVREIKKVRTDVHLHSGQFTIILRVFSFFIHCHYPVKLSIRLRLRLYVGLLPNICKTSHQCIVFSDDWHMLACRHAKLKFCKCFFTSAWFCIPSAQEERPWLHPRISANTGYFKCSLKW